MPDLLFQLITPHVKDLGGFSVRRSLPQDDFNRVGPFVFFDHLGPATFEPGKGIDVRPHPHINLATVTYLFEGSVMHRDSLGTVQEITPGAVNWMTAGKGIVHSERSPENFREQTATLHAIQTWLALPEAAEETEPTFHHYPAADLPKWTQTGSALTLIAGQLGDRTSPVTVHSPTLYLDVQLAKGGHFSLPADYSDRAVYSVTSGISLNGEPIDKYRLAVLDSGQPVDIAADETARCIVVGGEPVGDRIKYWNFVSSWQSRIEQAKQDWKAQRFDKVPHEDEFIPLPDAE